jgi:6-phosphogluconolactonase (cycloisomerase 2 family)
LNDIAKYKITKASGVVSICGNKKALLENPRGLEMYHHSELIIHDDCACCSIVS